MPANVHLAREAYAYWHAAQRLRLSAAEQHVDWGALAEIEMVGMHTDNLVIRGDCVRLIETAAELVDAA